MMHLTPQGHSKSLIDEAVAIRDGMARDGNQDNENVFTADIYVSGELSETFAMLDPDLALLFKDMKTAAVQLSSARKSDGVNIDLAKWRLESAQSAYQTRLLEVRKNHILSKAASESLDKGEAECMRISHELTMQERMNEQFAAMRKQRMEEKRRQEDEQHSWLLYFLIGLWIAQMARQNRLNNQFSMQNDFTNRARMA
jgi:hypothetical protein